MKYSHVTAVGRIMASANTARPAGKPRGVDRSAMMLTGGCTYYLRSSRGYGFPYHDAKTRRKSMFLCRCAKKGIALSANALTVCSVINVGRLLLGRATQPGS